MFKYNIVINTSVFSSVLGKSEREMMVQTVFRHCEIMLRAEKGGQVEGTVQRVSV